MLGAIIGDIVGSVYEFDNIKTKNFRLFSSNCFFTDDTVMTIAVYKALKKSKLFKYKNLQEQAYIDSFSNLHSLNNDLAMEKQDIAERTI